MSCDPKYFNDPVHGLVSFGDSLIDHLLLNLIDSVEFQRLRRVRQLGMAECVFPGATHTRLSHGIGVLREARRFADRLRELDESLLSEEQETVLLVSALLHDLGHGPFSHVFERITDDSHLDRTVEIVLDSSTSINAMLVAFDAQLPLLVGSFFIPDFAEATDMDVWPEYLTSIVSSQLDADRFDYLVRDSHFAGVKYGVFEADWLVKHLNVDDKGIYVQRKAFTAAESFVMARHHMYTSVYFHHATRAAEVMLERLFSRYKLLLRGCTGPQQVAEVVPGAPPAVVSAFGDAKLSLDQYLALDDSMLTVFIYCCQGARDPILSALGWGLWNRRLWKHIDVTHAKTTEVVKFVGHVRDELENQGADINYIWADDTPADTPYRPYNVLVAEVPIRVENGAGIVVEITEVSEALHSLTKQYSLARYYFASEVRGIVKQAEAEVLGGGDH
ncbi:MAG: HD domain-containing protein [Coriobacteriia bacterium]|nr:HD domain-containing protein [Coriobacteriia bacterium]